MIKGKQSVLGTFPEPRLRRVLPEVREVWGPELAVEDLQRIDGLLNWHGS
jgi:hypothetical protein